MEFSIYNAIKNTEEEKEKDIDKMLNQTEQAVKIIEKDMLTQ